jgi:hypothetical protein
MLEINCCTIVEITEIRLIEAGDSVLRNLLIRSMRFRDWLFRLG